MLRFAFLAVLLSVVCASPIDNESGSSDVDLTGGGVIIEQIPVADFSPTYKGIHFFRWGDRVAGDRLVYNGSYYETLPRVQHGAVARLAYPLDGTLGGVINHIFVHFKTDDYHAEARIVSGGIGQRTVTLEGRSQNTRHVSFDATIYTH